MGLPCFSKVFRYVGIAAVGLVAAIAIAIFLANPVAATSHTPGDRGQPASYSWDTDNLVYGSYNARSFNIPFHDYSGYSGVDACQSSVADAFFQTGDSSDADVPDDFPVIVYSTAGASLEPPSGTDNNTGCDLFVAQQERLKTQVAANTGYALDESGNLVVFAPTEAAFTEPRTATDLRYWHWADKGAYFFFTEPRNGTSDNGYLGRVDGISNYLRISPLSAASSINVPSDAASQGKFGAADWHGKEKIADSGIYQVAINTGAQRYLAATKSARLCPSGYHPRGEDSTDRVGSGTGRTLSGLTQTNAQIADRFWCRSDLRYKRSFKAQIHTTAGLVRFDNAPTGVFTSYGRLGCYYTTTGTTTLSNGGYRCTYRFPLPRCDSDDNGTADREYMPGEITALIAKTGNGATIGQQFKIDETADCSTTNTDPTTPPQQAGFDDYACVTAGLEIYENRVATSDAEPGVLATDRTLTVAVGTREAYDLDITSPHPRTASPPRDTTAGSGDPSGCASGAENRADHTGSPADAARKQSPAPSYAASSSGNSAYPPSASGDSGALVDYNGPRLNIAHRYASKVAENTCAAKLAEAEAELALLEEREDEFVDWLDDYKAVADTRSTNFGNYRKASTATGSGLAVLKFNDNETNKQTYAGLLATRYASLSAALVSAKTAYDNATDRSAGNNRAAVVVAGSNSGCVAHYDNEITRLKKLFNDAEIAALGTGVSGISEERAAIAGTNLAIAPSIAWVIPDAVTAPEISAIQTQWAASPICLGTLSPEGTCFGPPFADPDSCSGILCAGAWTERIEAEYRCPGGRYVNSGTVTGTYKSVTRSRTYSATYVAASRGSTTSASCPGFVAQTGATYASDAIAWVSGTAGTTTTLPSATSPAVTAAETLKTLDKLVVLGNYHSSHADRVNLIATTATDRNTAATSLTVAVGSVPTSHPQETTDWQTTYTTAYDNAYTTAIGHMGGTNSATWANFDWRYETSTLDWGGYLEDPGTTFSASTSTPKDGTGCDLVNVAADGEVTVQATRLDYETSSYGVGATYGTRTDSQRTCKVLRTRTPELLLMYAPAVHTGVDTSKTADSRLDTDSTTTNAEFYYIDYQPATTAERHKLHQETEIFAIKVSLADSAPVLCYQPGEALVAHVGAKGVDAVRNAVFSGASGFANGSTAHCYSHSGLPQSQAVFVWFDDTARKQDPAPGG